MPGWLVRQVNFECLSTGLTPFLEGAQKVSQQLDFWGMRQSRTWGDPVSRSAESTLPVAAQSYLVPWFEALAIATNFRTENTITSGCLAHVLDDFGNVAGTTLRLGGSQRGFSIWARQLRMCR